MAFAITISLIILVWYCAKAVRENPERPNWNKAIVTALFWPLSLFMKRYR
ncbi:hypothetical protein GCM10010967_33260 [Dyadobacter beijingensis]|uniref:Uncharacterized protein n=1 Tax=Dyadobacter beijingensis TaxID=365489 RepID=A0ABQ2I2Y8_9BACT|nr:hypothetical protein [Dyadobacter beijingensis]GGM96866.1 hypothetical protein GCM10010967_33260 [Dyadobacter beijingensis]